jgi:hypothetical protein
VKRDSRFADAMHQKSDGEVDGVMEHL